jgi:hypothetical protein
MSAPIPPPNMSNWEAERACGKPDIYRIGGQLERKDRMMR